MVNITVQQDGIQIGNFCCYAGSRIVFEKIQFVCAEDAGTFAVALPGIDNYVIFDDGSVQHSFPASIEAIKNIEGSLIINIPSTYENGRYVIKMSLTAVESRPLPIIGRCVAGLTPMLPISSISAYNGIVPYVLVMSFEDTTYGEPASADEKNAVISVLKDWMLETTDVVSAATDAINALTLGVSDSAEVYAAYLLVSQIRSNINEPTITHAVYKLYEELLEWQTI